MSIGEGNYGVFKLSYITYKNSIINKIKIKLQVLDDIMLMLVVLEIK